MKNYEYMELTEEEREDIEREHIIFRERTVDAGLIVPMHWHDYFEVDLIVFGSVRTRYNDTDFIAGAGSVFVSTYNDAHSYEFLERTNVITIRFDETVLNDKLNEYIGLCSRRLNCVFDKKEMEYFIGEFRLAERNQREKPLFYKMFVYGIISNMMISIIRKTSPEAVEKTHRAVQKVVGIVNKSFREDLTLKNIAQDMFVTSDYLGKIFRKETGVAFSTYLTSVRLRYACYLLSSTDVSVKEISTAAGFQSVEYFMYAFKKNMGKTPGKYRAEKKARK